MMNIEDVFSLSDLSKVYPQLKLTGSLNHQRYTVVYNLMRENKLVKDMYILNSQFLDYLYNSNNWAEFENRYVFNMKNTVKNYITGYFTTEAYAHGKQPWTEDKYKSYLKEKDSEIDEVVKNIMKANITSSDERVYDYIVFFHKDIPRLDKMFSPL